MKFHPVILWFLVLGLPTVPLAGAQTETTRQKQFNLQRGLALDGYDPVSYFTGKPEEGKKEWVDSYRGVTYYFASPSNREIFRRSPERYEPAYGGWCAYAMGASGEKVKVDPETFKIVEGRVYLFYNFWGNNTLESWNKDERGLKSSGDKHWALFFP